MIEPSFEPSQPLGIIKGLRVRMIEASVNAGMCMHKDDSSHFLRSVSLIRNTVAQMKKLSYPGHEGGKVGWMWGCLCNFKEEALTSSEQ